MNKRPIVYTIRELLTYDDEYNSCLIGYFVSRAYIAHLDITYHKTGAAVKKYDILNPRKAYLGCKKKEIKL